MSEQTIGQLTSIIDRPGLAFYTAYAHVEDVAAHLASIRDKEGENDNDDKYHLSTLTSCILSSQELLLGLLYRTDLCDFRVGVDKFALGLTVSNILASFKSVLDIAAALDREDCGDRDEKELIIAQNDSAQATSFFHKLAKAESLGLLSSGTKEAISSSLKIMKEYVRIDSKTAESLQQLNDAVGSDSVFASPNTCEENYSYLALRVPSLILKAHQNIIGGVEPSSHGPEDYIFQIAHVILEHFFWYIENVLSGQPSGVGSKDGSSLIIMKHIFDSCTDVLGLLDYMILADFHPLRVAVHGSSGFYSQAWHRIRAWFGQAFRGTTETMKLDHVHICPEMFAQQTLYLQRLDRASASFRTMCFRHYALAERTIGSNSMGSAGKSFEQMQGSFLKHPSVKYNAAKYRVHEYTNVKYASFVGLGTQAVLDDANAALGNDDTALDKVGYKDFDEESSCQEEAALSSNFLAEMERCFVESDVQAFVELFNTSNCRIEHPPATLPYLGAKVKAYFQNFMKRHPVIHSFKCSCEMAGHITIDVDADLFDSTRVQYQIKGDCVLDANGSILRLLVSGLVDMSAALFENNDQRVSNWTSRQQSQSDFQSLQQAYRRPLSPAEMLAYELNQNKSGKKISDGLTIVSRSLIQGQFPSHELVRDAINQVVKRHTLLNARIEVKGSVPYFVVDGNVKPLIEIIEGAGNRLDCERYLNTQFDVENGDMIRVILSKLESSFELVTVMFHGICDAISARDLHYQFVCRLATVGSNADDPDCLFVLKETPLQTSIPLPATHHAKAVLNERTKETAEPIPPPVPVPIVVTRNEASDEHAPRSIAVTSKLSQDETKSLLVACRARDTTVHACIAAAALLSADCGESNKRVLTSAVDLRRRLQMRTDELVYAVGGFDGSAGFEYDLDEVGDFWSLCQAIRSDLVGTIDSGRLLTTYLSSIEGLVGAYKAGYLDGGCFGTVFLSNIGNEHYQNNWESCVGRSSTTFMVSFFLAALTIISHVVHLMDV
ncbi:hypothetical protein QTG54_006798 [Skeletonema marinoi]|uniref:Phthiocerol/phthiodiolone dimycocerosyl transferase C-terminal domain-containing protein n=1 Tax=Skeletonema marinoi TaxID=267567 RepID=A0AAD8YAK8_9STRA|nr:hypothetical protein QTG54_006798 [Skeletonema marinoi]